MEAKRCYIDQVFNTFRLMGNASGLFIKETVVKVVFLSDDPLPLDLVLLDCNWEGDRNCTKFLGFHVRSEISSPLLIDQLFESM